MKIAFGMIVFNGNYVLKQCLESIYPYANQIVIAEGPVQYWQDEGYSTSTDGTNEIIDNFPDPENKITIIHKQYTEKSDQSNTYMREINNNNDYIWQLDSDEIYKPKDIKTIISLLEKEKYTNVSFQSCTFYGGFDYKLTGFEENCSFHRLFKIYPGSTWLKHRPPKIKHCSGIKTLPTKILTPSVLYSEYNIRMYHYSYVFSKQVSEKVGYYKKAVSKDTCIDDYFEKVYLSWVLGDTNKKKEIEDIYNGVHEFKPDRRPDCRTALFKGEHPQIILRDMEILKDKFIQQLKQVNSEN